MSDRSHNRKSALFRMPRNDAIARDCNISNMQIKQIVVLKYMLCNEVVYQKLLAIIRLLYGKSGRRSWRVVCCYASCTSKTSVVDDKK